MTFKIYVFSECNMKEHRITMLSFVIEGVTYYLDLSPVCSSAYFERSAVTVCAPSTSGNCSYNFRHTCF